jgi:hypothetical protein
MKLLKINLKTMSEFFIRKKLKGVNIPEPGPFDITNTDDILSCGLNREDFTARNAIMFDNDNGFEVKEGNNPIASISARLVDHFSKRELAFLLSKEMLNRLMADVKKAETKNGK